MKSYEILNHPADLKIRAFGKSLPELFTNIALAVAQQQKNKIDKKDKGEWEEIQIESPDLESLLVDWLSEILYRSETRKKVYFDFDVEELRKTKLRGKIKGVVVQQKSLDIKAATYHDLLIKKAGQHWQATVIFDI